jgi:hypothetical protein
MQRQNRISCTFAIALIALAGCPSSPSRLSAPTIAGDAAAAAIKKCDANGDGAIGGDELNKAPSIKAAVKRIDANNDGKVTADEIDERIAVWKKSGIAITRAVAWVRQGGRPLADVDVTFIPEDFLGPNLKPVVSKTDTSGAAYLQISGKPEERGIALGFYRVELSKKGADGKDTIPARYNSETTLGAEITPDDPNLARITFDISPR